MLLSQFCFFLLGLTLCSAQTFYVAAPNTIRLDAEETVAISQDGQKSEKVSVYLQDHPRRRNLITNLDFTLPPAHPEIFRIKVRSEDIPETDFSNLQVKHYVILTVHSGSFRREVIIPISSKSGYFFIQTDKPIYTPKQSVNIRLIPVNERTIPSNKEFKLQIKNPQNIAVKEVIFNAKENNDERAFVSYIYNFPPEPLLGEWAVVAYYGSHFQHNSNVTFELKEYVLPTFTLKLKLPNVILPGNEDIEGSVQAKYVYGKNVEGTATFKFGIKDATGPVTFFAVRNNVELIDGIADFRLHTDHLKNQNNVGWFPLIDGKHFVVEATVLDFASGKKEVISDESGKFSESPYTISFQRCLKDFKPGLVSVIEADIKYVNGNPAPEIQTVISAVADNGVELEIENPTATSDEEGKVTFLIHPEMQHTTVTVTLKTDEPQFGESQAVGTHTQQKFISNNQGYIAIARRSGSTMKPGETFAEDIHLEPAEIANIYFIVVSKGRIVLMNKLREGNFKVHKVQFQITHEMAPSFRLVVFAHHRNELIADSLKVNVAEQCSPEAKVKLVTDFPSTEPGSDGKIIIEGTKNTLVGLLAVDEAVYSLRDKDRLTKSKMFKTLETHDLGCGPGGGRSTNIVLGNAGVVIMTSFFSPPMDAERHTCEEKFRRKRQAVADIVGNFTGRAHECCRLGMRKDKHGRTCETRSAVIDKMLKDNFKDNCSAVFLKCCLHKYSKESQIVREKNINQDFDELDFFDGDDDEDLMELGTNVRSYFRETWIFEEKLIGPDNREEIRASLPHSITTWVIQAVSVSPEWGMCVAEPSKVVTFQNIFLQLNLPYSVVRQEQVEIQAIVFNYGASKIAVTVYMYGVEDICSGALPGERSERKKLFVEAQSSGSVSFPIIPLKDGEFSIKVVALSSRGSDAVIRKLNVVPEGYPVEKHIVIKLDPSNQQQRKKRDIISPDYSDSIEDTKRLQVTAIKLGIPDNFIPGSESCVVSAIADEFGPVVEAAVQDPESLMHKAHGCGEQTMMYMAPTIYTMRYLRDARKLTREIEARGLNFIQEGYERELTFRKADGSYSAFPKRPTSTWLTAFVMKVFCQANSWIEISEDVICSGVRWLINHQNADGSFIDNKPVLQPSIMGGVDGSVPMTAFVLIALEECTCDVERLALAKARAVSYLENVLDEVKTPHTAAIVAYAMSLSSSELSDVAYEKLSMMEFYDEDTNTLHWSTGKDTEDIEVTSYGLLTNLRYEEYSKSTAIVNWLNTKRLVSGTFPSTQDSVMALQALSEYAVAATAPRVDLVCNISSSSDKDLHKRFVFNEENAMVSQEVRIAKPGGLLFVNTEGYGVGLLSTRLKYNIPVPPEKQCKFEVTVTDIPFSLQKGLPADYEYDTEGPTESPDADINPDPEQTTLKATPDSPEDEEVIVTTAKPVINVDQKDFTLKIQICVKYLGDKPSDMTIVEAGIFSGFEPMKEDLQKLVKSEVDLIQKYELSSRSITFYLEMAPPQTYCFRFRLRREYIVGNTQTSVVRVYDYYSPEESCTVFYAPDQNSPMLRAICDEGVCQCAEGGCPPEDAFEQVESIQDLDASPGAINEAMREELIRMACDEYDYAWRGRVTGKTREAGFLHIDFTIEVVIKEGIEKAVALKGAERNLIARESCRTADLKIDQQYIIMGHDGERYQDEDGNIWHRYLLDKSTALHEWSSNVAARNRLQKAFSFVEKSLPKHGCKN